MGARAPRSPIPLRLGRFAGVGSRTGYSARVPAIPGRVRLADHTTLRLGGWADRFVEACDEGELLDELRRADDAQERVLVIGSGSNLVVGDDGFPGTVLRVSHRGLRRQQDGDHVLLDVAAGEIFDEIVAGCVAEGLAGLECLSGIPGRIGATPIQNVGAYGAEISDTLVAVRVFDRDRQRVRWLSAAECGFGYRTSVLRRRDRLVVLGVRLRLRRSRFSAPIRYRQLADALGISVGEGAPLDAVRQTVLELRAAKGMLLDASDPDTVSAGSFFTNPIVPLERVPVGAPAWPVGEDSAKLSAAWLIEHAGFSKGHRYGGVGISGKHALALVNYGGTTKELLSLARDIRDAVRATFGITLEVEPVLVGASLD